MRRQRRSQPRTTESELQHLRDSVHSLQKDAQDQLTLEMESQASFEHIYAQVSGLRSAFDTLSDVLLEEVDSLRAETSKRFDQLTLHVEKQDRVLANVSQDLSVLKRTIDVWGLKERDWAKDNEILKVSHSHNAEWMKTMQRDLMEVKDEMRAVKDDSSVAAKDLREESGSLRALWEQSLEKVNARTKELEASIDRQQIEIRGITDQRVDDYELLQKAMSTLQAQQVRLRKSVEESGQANRVDIRSSAGKISQFESTLASIRMDSAELRRRLNDMDSDTHLQFQNVSRVFKVFSDALDISMPQLSSSQVSSERR